MCVCGMTESLPDAPHSGTAGRDPNLGYPGGALPWEGQVGRD